MLKELMLAITILGGPSSLAEHFEDAAIEQGVPVEVLIGVAKFESDFKREVRSSSGACCFMQLLGGRYGNPSCSALEKDDRLCITQGAKEIGDLLKKHGNIQKALCHYHSGNRCNPKSNYPPSVLWWAEFVRAVINKEPAGYWECGMQIQAYGIDRYLRAPVWAIPMKNASRRGMANYSKNVQKEVLLQLKYQSCAEAVGMEWDGKFRSYKGREDYSCVTSKRTSKCVWREEAL